MTINKKHKGKKDTSSKISYTGLIQIMKLV